jgi:hypothetical protein
MTPSSTIPSWFRFFTNLGLPSGCPGEPFALPTNPGGVALIVAPKAARSGEDTVAGIQGRADLTGNQHVSEGPGALRSVASQLRYSGWAGIRPLARISDCGRPGEPRRAVQTSSPDRAIKHVKAELTSVDGATEINAFGGVEASLEGGGEGCGKTRPEIGRSDRDWAHDGSWESLHGAFPRPHRDPGWGPGQGETPLPPMAHGSRG